MAGIWLSHDAKDFEDAAYKQKVIDEVRAGVERYKNDPSLLLWSIGNEIQLGANTEAAWRFVEELGQLIKSLDPNHPLTTATAHCPVEVVDNVVRFAPSIEILSINSYGGLPVVPQDLEKTAFRGPWIVSEWGPNGHWEAGKTPWGRVIEPPSAVKAETYRTRAEFLSAHADACLGNYVFLWGQKQERTPTWYSMWVETIPALGLAGETTATVDVMAEIWSGEPPSNRAPEVGGLELSRLPDGAGMAPQSGVLVEPGARLRASVAASDPDADALHYVWEILVEPNAYGEGGSFEGRPSRVELAFQKGEASVEFSAPAAGEYRLFVYALDGQGHVGTANFPFKVQ
jgi:hypothetical protein